MFSIVLSVGAHVGVLPMVPVVVLTWTILYCKTVPVSTSVAVNALFLMTFGSHVAEPEQ